MATASPVKELRLVLVGKTGTGKSTTGNSLLNQKGHFICSSRSDSVTKKCEHEQAELDDGTSLLVVDTPGLFDTSLSEQETKKEIEKCIGIASPGPHVILLVLKIGRFTKEELVTVQRLIDIFGEEILDYFIIVFTGKDDLEEEDCTIDEYVKTLPRELLELIRKCKERYAAINNRAQGPNLRKDVDYILGLIRKTIGQNCGEHYSGEMFEQAERRLREKMREKERLRGITEEQARAEVRQEVSAEEIVTFTLRFLWTVFEIGRLFF